MIKCLTVCCALVGIAHVHCKGTLRNTISRPLYVQYNVRYFFTREHNRVCVKSLVDCLHANEGRFLLFIHKCFQFSHASSSSFDDKLLGFSDLYELRHIPQHLTFGGIGYFDSKGATVDMGTCILHKHFVTSRFNWDEIRLVFSVTDICRFDV